MQRCFIACELAADAREALARALGPVKRVSRDDRPRFVDASNYHLTLRFLGPVSEAAIADLKGGLGERISPLPEVQGGWAGFGGLPQRARAHVFAVVFRDDQGALGLVQRRVEELCVELGFPAETRPFKPHLTLARFNQAVDVRSYLAKAQPPAQSVVITSVALFRSTLLPGGARYDVLERVRLTPAPAADA